MKNHFPITLTRIRRLRRSLCLGLLGAVLAVCGVAVFLSPVSTRLTRAATLLYLAVLGAACLALLWKRRPLRYAFAALTALVLLFLVFPGRAYAPRRLREQYVASLLAYEGCPYFWGGESARGIDCSGLVRRGMMDAEVICGLKSLNSRLVRQGLSLWWHDCTARQLGKGYLGLTDSLLSATSINALDHSRLLPGDIAVTRDGIHTLAYVGDSTWIEADPGPHRVVRVRVPRKDDLWFRVPVDIVRWAQLREAAGR